MKSLAPAYWLVIAGFCWSLAVTPARAADEPTIERMATCKESWLDWKDDPSRSEKFATTLHANYTQKDGGYLVPKSPTMLMGLPIVRVYPESIGMGVGFSVAVTGKFDVVKKAVEKAAGKSLVCEADSDGMHACQAELASKRTVMVASDTGDSAFVLIGCFYFYEK
jgi:hypothetical protein